MIKYILKKLFYGGFVLWGVLTLVFFLFVTIIATLGYGLLYSYIFKKDFLELDIGYIGIFGCLFLITISYLTNIFFSHGKFHNLIIDKGFINIHNVNLINRMCYIYSKG